MRWGTVVARYVGVTTFRTTVNIRKNVSNSASTAMLARWKRRQGVGRGQPGSVDGRLVTRDGRAVPTPEEETVFQVLGMQPVPPEPRSGEEW
jgi:hypothetical protein